MLERAYTELRAKEERRKSEPTPSQRLQKAQKMEEYLADME
jgi:hypothetical protein